MHRRHSADGQPLLREKHSQPDRSAGEPAATGDTRSLPSARPVDRHGDGGAAWEVGAPVIVKFEIGRCPAKMTSGYGITSPRDSAFARCSTALPDRSRTRHGTRLGVQPVACPGSPCLACHLGVPEPDEKGNEASEKVRPAHRRPGDRVRRDRPAKLYRHHQLRPRSTPSAGGGSFYALHSPVELTPRHRNRLVMSVNRRPGEIDQPRSNLSPWAPPHDIPSATYVSLYLI